MDDWGQGYASYKANEALNANWSQDKKKGWNAASNADWHDQKEQGEAERDCYRYSRY